MIARHAARNSIITVRRHAGTFRRNVHAAIQTQRRRSKINGTDKAGTRLWQFRGIAGRNEDAAAAAIAAPKVKLRDAQFTHHGSIQVDIILASANALMNHASKLEAALRKAIARGGNQVGQGATRGLQGAGRLLAQVGAAKVVELQWCCCNRDAAKQEW